MENLIIFIIFIIFSALRTLADNWQKTGQKPGSKPAGSPVPPVPRLPRPPIQTIKLPPEYQEAFFAAEATKKETIPEKVLFPAQTIISEPAVVESALKSGEVFSQEQLFRPLAATVFQGIIYAEVFGSPRAKKRWKYRK